MYEVLLRTVFCAELSAFSPQSPNAQLSCSCRQNEAEAIVLGSTSIFTSIAGYAVPPSVHQTHIDLLDLHLFDYEEFGVDDEGTTYRSAAIREIESHRESILRTLR